MKLHKILSISAQSRRCILPTIKSEYSTLNKNNYKLEEEFTITKTSNVHLSLSISNNNNFQNNNYSNNKRIFPTSRKKFNYYNFNVSNIVNNTIQSFSNSTNSKNNYGRIKHYCTESTTSSTTPKGANDKKKLKLPKLSINKIINTNNQLQQANLQPNINYDANERAAPLPTTSLSKKLKRKLAKASALIDPEKLYADESANVPNAELKKNAAQLSATLRARTRTAFSVEHPVPMSDVAPIVYKKEEAIAYIAHRLPGVYACTYRVFSELVHMAPDFQPKTMIDFGSGPGTAIWSATQHFNSLLHVLSIEPSNDMTIINKQLVKSLPVNMYYKQHIGSDIADLVIASYVFTELPSNEARRTALVSLWKHTAIGGMLVIVEPGTPVGFKVIKDARELLLRSKLASDVEVIAPCCHSNACPMERSSWCHFPQRVYRTSWQLATKQDASINWEDEKYSYIILHKPSSANTTKRSNKYDSKLWGRVVEHLKKRGGHVSLKSCDSSAILSEKIISKKHGKPLYTSARKARWGDAIIFADK